MAKYYGNRRTQQRQEPNLYSRSFFVTQVAKAQDQSPVMQIGSAAEKRWYSASFIADQVEGYFKDLLQITRMTPENIQGCAITLARNVKGRPSHVILEIQELCQQYVEALDAEKVKDEALNLDAQLALIRHWLTSYVECKKLGKAE